MKFLTGAEIFSAIRLRLKRIARPGSRYVEALDSLFADPPADWSWEQKVFLARALRRANLLSDFALSKLLAQLFAKREVALVRSIVNDGDLGLDLVREYYGLRLAAYQGDETVSLDEIGLLYRRAKGSFLSVGVLHEFLTRAVQLGAVDCIENRLAELSPTERRQINANVVLGVTRLLLANGRYERAVSLLNDRLRRADALRRLYFLEPLLELRTRGGLSPALVDFCKGFDSCIADATVHSFDKAYKGIDAADRATVEQFVIEPVRSILSIKPNLMDVRFSRQEREDLLAKVKWHVANQQPLSLLRLGDGEAYAFNASEMTGLDASLVRADDQIRARHWWGEAPPPHIREDISVRVRRAIEHCDILGIPSIYRVIRDLPPPHRRYGESLAQRGLMSIFAACRSAIPLDGKILTEERCHQIALDESAIIELTNLANSVVIVSCWPQDQIQLPVATKLISIPPAQKLKRWDQAQLPPLFEVYDDIVMQIRDAAAPGTLVLVGAGLIGKVLVDEARQSGAVALDVGSMLDYLAGHKTRSLADLS